MKLNYTVADVEVDKLKLDRRNPRIPDQAFSTEEDALEFLVGVGALDELVQSIASSGWIDYEPLIVLADTDEVIEGNRRLAALRLIADPDHARAMGVPVPSVVHPDAQPEEVTAWLVRDRKDARDYIGFKHINGPFKWDSFAKAKYAAEWLADEDDLPAVARRLGDTHKTVERLVNGYKVLRQAEKLGFERERVPGRFSFSHLYTALTRPNYRRFLGLPDTTGLLPDDPLDREHKDQLLQLMVWLYGQDDTPSVIKSQNPDLKRLAEVLPNRTAVAMLTQRPDLNAAHALVENKAQLFAESVFALSASATKTASLIGFYGGGDEELEEVMDTIVRTVRGIQASMRSDTQEPPGPL